MLLGILLHSMHFSSLFISLLLGFYILWRNSQQPLVCLMALSTRNESKALGARRFKNVEHAVECFLLATTSSQEKTA